MSLTYNEILDSMKTAFLAEKGETVKELSDLEMRFKAVASEIYSLCAYGDYVLKQGFPQTATGEYLERHAALRGITRKKASRATGTLTFSLAQAIDKSVTIPEGTVCSVSGKPFVRFSTDKTVEIKAGALSAEVTATALEEGDAHNAAQGTVTVMVNPPDYVYSVTNALPFKGGWDAESDESLRERVMSSYGSYRNRVSKESLREIILSLEDVTDASLEPDQEHVMRVYLKTRNGEISEKLKEQINDMLGFAVLCSTTIVYEPAKAQPFNVVAEAKVLSGYGVKEIESNVREKIARLCSSEKIGQSYKASDIASACGNTEGIVYINIYFGESNASVATCSAGAYLKLENIEVNVHE